MKIKVTPKDSAGVMKPKTFDSFFDCKECCYMLERLKIPFVLEAGNALKGGEHIEKLAENPKG